MNARFLVEDVTTITGRGAVAMGRILEGNLNPGMFTQPLPVHDQSKPLKITGVEVAQTIPERQPKIGLLFENIPAHDLRGALPADSVLAIFELVEDAERAV